MQPNTKPAALADEIKDAIRGLSGDSSFPDLLAAVDKLAADAELSQAGRLSYFAYDPDTGFERFNTEAEAKEYAQTSINAYRDAAGDGWDESVENVCWGVVHGTTQQIAVEDDYDGRDGLGDMLFADYILTAGSAPQPAQQPASATEEAARKLRERFELIYSLCCGTAPKQSVGELMAVTLDMPEWTLLAGSQKGVDA
ncbi:hypothetical protein CEK28_08595 [Xenophilus sp. AP218F]|nr:hypothetical protein CEK28_08595 [Xenophilus sp. AP218F]